MNDAADKALLWAPRILGILVSLFLGMFALDAFEGGKSLAQALPDLLLHLIPTVVLLTIVAVSWKREWIGGVVFVALGVGYAFMASDHPSWIAVISLPLLAVGALFLWSWWHRRKGATKGMRPRSAGLASGGGAAR